MGLLADLADLVLPAGCAGCGAAGRLLCPACAPVLVEPPGPARPTPAPPGLPVCLSGGEYAGIRRELVLAYKERGRRALAGPLGDALAGVVRTGWSAGAGPVVLVPVPSTAAAIRSRYGDHMRALARRTAATLRRDGLDASIARPLRARPKADSAHLDRWARADAARHAFVASAGGRDLARLRVAADAGAVVVLDDVLTTGATLAAVAGELWRLGVPVTFAATVAASRLRNR